jgi:hypothetical protein
MIADGAIQDFSIGGTSRPRRTGRASSITLLDDSKYVFSPDVGDQELFTPDPNLNAPLVRVVQVRMALRQDDATQRWPRRCSGSAARSMRATSSISRTRPSRSIAASWELSPATGVSFTGAEVNGLQPA